MEVEAGETEDDPSVRALREKLRDRLREAVGGGRWACMSVRKILARAGASPGSDFLRETLCRSR
ncbi:hypothetical protein GCM10010405_51230 [Streptomyces macrosporus]|uniref:Uncharacterized protein n=1 Tax=Streptomyces macrosporus TaxID=44032 RepID=A0ABN3KHZ2_9ACTN